MRFAFFLMLFIGLRLCSVAGGIKGRITTKQGEALPFAGIAVKGTSNGTMANEDGEYEFSLPAGTYELIFQYLGFKSVSRSVTITNDFQELNITLEEQALNLQEATIGKGKEDPAYSIMRRAIAKARFHQLQLRGYTAKVYSRSTALPLKSLTSLRDGSKKKEYRKGKPLSMRALQKSNTVGPAVTPNASFLPVTASTTAFLPPTSTFWRVCTAPR
jgi:hypothetical protein